MKFNKNYCGLVAAGVALAAIAQSCASDEPFAVAEGEGEVMMKMQINSELTRAEVVDQALSDSCVVYVSKGQKLLHKYKGLDNLPESLRLSGGSYLAEAWTGDSVTASFDKKFYYGKEPFEIADGDKKSVAITCRIANVVVSVNPATVNPDLMKDWTITVSNSRGSLDFTAENMDAAKGYFMMPQADMVKDADGNFLRDDAGNIYYTNLKYTISGKRADGGEFTKSGLIFKDGAETQYVQRTHEYVLNLKYDPDFEQTGGSFIDIVVDDSEISVEEEHGLYSRPAFKGVNFDIDRQIVGNAGAFGAQQLQIKAYGGIESIFLTSVDYAAFKIDAAGSDLVQATETVKNEYKAAGYDWDIKYLENSGRYSCILTLAPALLNALRERDTEYVLNVKVIDGNGKENELPIRIAVGAGAVVIDDPLVTQQVDTASDLMAVGARSAVVPVTLSSADVVNPAVQYRKEGDSAWTTATFSVPAKARTRAGMDLKVTLGNLEPGTTYEYRVVADGFESKDIFKFTTEGIFVIPNAGMEEWSNFVDNSAVVMPSDDGTKKFWDSGNHGSAKMKKNITQKFTGFFNGGSACAELKSQFLGLGSLGKFAAGNIFAGEYLETQGTNGKLSFGRPYNGSHPSKLVLYANYRPGTGVKGKGADDKYIKAGATDEGQIYVALTTEPVEIRTNPSDQKLFNPDESCVLAYGQHTFTSNFGADSRLERVEIPLEYYERAKTKAPLYLVIVCSASKYGDFFSGGEGSVMYLDDFELVYDK